MGHLSDCSSCIQPGLPCATGSPVETHTRCIQPILVHVGIQKQGKGNFWSTEDGSRFAERFVDKFLPPTRLLDDFDFCTASAYNKVQFDQLVNRTKKQNKIYELDLKKD